MLVRPVSLIYMSAILSTGGSVGGWVITGKLAGDEAASSFLKLSVCVVLIALVVQAVLLVTGKRRTIFQILFTMASFFGLLWMMSCLVLPIFWMPKIGRLEKLIFLILALLLFSTNARKGAQCFSSGWDEKHQILLAKFYKKNFGIIDWGGLVGSLKLSVSIYVPGISGVMNSVLSVVIVISMLVGFSLRNIYPVVSVFACGIPAVIVISTFLQMLGVGVGQIMMLIALEKRDGNRIRSL